MHYYFEAFSLNLINKKVKVKRRYRERSSSKKKSLVVHAMPSMRKATQPNATRRAKQRKTVYNASKGKPTLCTLGKKRKKYVYVYSPQRALNPR